MRNVVGLIAANPALAIKAVMLRKYGQEIIHTLGGRRIHPVFAVPGGVNKALQAVERDTILAGVDEAIATIQVGLEIMEDWAEANMEDINKFAVFPTGYFGLVTPENGLELYDGQIRLIGADGQQLEKFDGKNYLDIIAEHVENWSYLKFPYYKKMGYPQGVYRVGPLGRLNIVGEDRYSAGERRAEEIQGLQQRQTGGKHPVLPLRPPDRSAVRGGKSARCCAMTRIS